MSKTARGVRRSSTEWASLIEACAQSGLSRSAFAEREGLHLPTFAWWAYRLRKESRPARDPKEPSGALRDATKFVRVRIGAIEPDGTSAANTDEHAEVAPASMQGVEVVLTNGRVVRCQLEHVGDSRLAALLSLAEGARAC